MFFLSQIPPTVFPYKTDTFFYLSQAYARGKAGERVGGGKNAVGGKYWEVRNFPIYHIPPP